MQSHSVPRIVIFVKVHIFWEGKENWKQNKKILWFGISKSFLFCLKKEKIEVCKFNNRPPKVALKCMLCTFNDSSHTSKSNDVKKACQE